MSFTVKNHSGHDTDKRTNSYISNIGLQCKHTPAVVGVHKMFLVYFFGERLSLALSRPTICSTRVIHFIGLSTSAYRIRIANQVPLLLYVVIVVPPRIFPVRALWHCIVALQWLNFFKERIVYVELMVFESTSSIRLLFSVQQILPGLHELQHSIVMLEFIFMFSSLGLTVHVFSC